MKGFGRALFKKDKKDKKQKKRSSSDYNLDDIPSASLSALMNTATSGTIAAAVQSKGNDTTTTNTNTATTLGSTASAFDPNYNRNMNYTPSVGGPSDNLSTSTSVTTVNVVRRASVRLQQHQQQQLQQQQQQQQHHERTMLNRDHVTNESKLRVQRDQIQMDKMLDLKRRLKFMKHNTDEDDNEMLSARSKRTSIGQLTQPTTDDARISDVKQSPPKKAKSSLTEEVEKWSSFDQQGSNEDYGVWFSKLCLSQLYSDEMFESFYELKLLSRQLNVQLPVPEFVVIGKRGHGKSALIESLIGYSVNYVNSENVSLIEESNTLAPTTIRPVIIQLVYNDRYRAEPRCTVYYYEQQLVGGNGRMNTDDLDSLAQQEGMEGGAEEETDSTFQYDRQRIRQIKVSSGDLTVSEVSSEIEALCKRLNSSKELTNQNRDPIYLQMEYAYFFDMTIVDTPGIVKEYQTSSSNSDRHDAESEVDGESSVRSWNDIVNEYVAPSHRHIIAVEEASEWADIDIINFVKKFDPALTRSTFVFTKFHSLIKALSNDELQRFLQLTPKMNQFFFVSLFGARLRNAVHKERDQYDRTVLHAYIRDRRMLNQLRYDTIYSESMGIFKFRAHIFHKAYLNYHANIPEVLSCIRSSIRAREQQLNILNQAALAQRKIRDDQTTIALRRIATEYTTSFLRILRDLLNGTSFGHPNETGQSLMDEIEHGVGPWLDSNYNQIDIPRGDDLQFTEENLYGGQQMRRLLHEYEKICDALKLGDLTYDDIGSAAGLSSGSNTAGLYWASSEVVHNRLIPEMKSFLQQLIHRASFIVKRLPALVDRIMNEIARQPLLRGSARGAALDMERYVYFKSYISELFEEFVDIVAKVAHNKCLSEFYETKTIYWSAQLELRGIQVDFSNIEQSLMDISSRLFTLTKDRMVKAIVMKTYSFFVNPIQSDLWGFIHSRLSGLSDVQLEQIFELEAVKNSLASDRAKLKLDLENQYVQESSFVKFSTIFTKAFQVVNQDRLSISLKQAPNSNKYRYDLRGLETDRWTDEKLNFEEQQKQLQASLELNKMSLQRRQSTRRATILARSPARAEDAKMTISTEPVRDTLESERVSTFDTEDDIDSDSDSDAEDLCDENLDLIIDRLDKADPSFTKLDLRSVTQKLKMVSIYQIQDFAAALGENQYLKVVDLSDSGVSNSVLNMIALLLKDNSVVESLDLSKNEIDDGAVQSLCKLIETSNSLTSLNLDKTYIQSAGFETLYHAISKNNKRHLKISLNQFASEQTREKFGRLR